ncbi:MAG: hypothetical protein ACREC0_09160 [Methylocella sp.]
MEYLPLAFAAVAMSAFVIDMADARGRTGSYRYGGYISHGKGSHYD